MLSDNRQKLTDPIYKQNKTNNKINIQLLLNFFFLKRVTDVKLTILRYRIV